MGEILPDGTIGGYSNYCPKCGKTISVNEQGNELGKHDCIMKTPNTPIGMIKLTINGIPLAKQSFRYAVRPKKDGTNFVSKYQPKKVVDKERNLQWDIKSQLAKDFTPFDCPLDVSITFTFPPPKSWNKSQKLLFKSGVRMFKDTKPDLDNLEKIVFDSMQGIVYINDSRVCEKRSRKVYGDVPSIVILIEPIAETKAVSQPKDLFKGMPSESLFNLEPYPCKWCGIMIENGLANAVEHEEKCHAKGIVLTNVKD